MRHVKLLETLGIGGFTESKQERDFFADLNVPPSDFYDVTGMYPATLHACLGAKRNATDLKPFSDAAWSLYVSKGRLRDQLRFLDEFIRRTDNFKDHWQWPQYLLELEGNSSELRSCLENLRAIIGPLFNPREYLFDIDQKLVSMKAWVATHDLAIRHFNKALAWTEAYPFVDYLRSQGYKLP